MGQNADRAEALMKDLKVYNPRRLKEMKKQGNVLKQLETFLDGVDEKEASILETLKAKIPQGMEPEAYEQELNWRRQQAREMAQEEVNQLLRN